MHCTTIRARALRGARGTRITLAAAATATAGLATLFSTAPASAHAVDKVAPYTIAIGWVNEPTYVGLPNAVQFFVWQGTGDGYQAHPVSDLNGDKTKPDVQVTVSFGSTTGKPLFLSPTFDPDTGLGNPAEYDASLTPTQVGNYTFHLTGNIHGAAVDKSYTSGPDTFNSVEDQSAVDFPSTLPAIGDVSTKVDRVTNRVTAVVGEQQQTSSTASSANDAANRATVLAIVGLILAVVLGGANLAMGARRRA